MLDGIITRAQHVPRTEYHLAVTLPERRAAVVGFARAHRECEASRSSGDRGEGSAGEGLDVVL